MICGDLFNDGVIQRIRRVRPDVLLHPMARCFADGSNSQDRWDSDEVSTYAMRAKAAGTTTLTVNYLADVTLNGGGFGGAWVFGPTGEAIDQFPLGREGVLIAEAG